MSKLGKLEAGRVAFYCPGCKEAHQIHVEGVEHPVWTFNGSCDVPTFTPSILVGGYQIEQDEKGEWTGGWLRGADGKPLPLVCHSFVTDGRIQFLGDCTHALAGTTVELPDWVDDG